MVSSGCGDVANLSGRSIVTGLSFCPKIIIIRRITMTAIRVQHGKDEETTHPDVTKWVIDEAERLHIVGENGSGNVASYNRGYWANVVIVP